MSINVCNDRSMASITSLPSGVSGSSLVLYLSRTASSSATISFTSGIDSTYKEYIFKFIDVHPATDDKIFNISNFRYGGTNYDATKQAHIFRAYHMRRWWSSNALVITGGDLAQGTSQNNLHSGI